MSKSFLLLCTNTLGRAAELMVLQKLAQGLPRVWKFSKQGTTRHGFLDFAHQNLVSFPTAFPVSSLLLQQRSHFLVGSFFFSVAGM